MRRSEGREFRPHPMGFEKRERREDTRNQGNTFSLGLFKMQRTVPAALTHSSLCVWGMSTTCWRTYCFRAPAASRRPCSSFSRGAVLGDLLRASTRLLTLVAKPQRRYSPSTFRPGRETEEEQSRLTSCENSCSCRKLVIQITTILVPVSNGL